MTKILWKEEVQVLYIHIQGSFPYDLFLFWALTSIMHCLIYPYIHSTTTYAQVSMPGAEEAVVDRIQALSLQQACCPAEIRGMPSTLAIKKEWGCATKQENSRRKGSHQITSQERLPRGIEVYTPKGEDQLKEWRAFQAKNKACTWGRHDPISDPE